MNDAIPIIAFFGGFLSGWEIILMLTVLLLAVLTRPGFLNGMRKGLFEFGRSGKEVVAELDEAAHEAGRSAGGIHGKPAAEALTTDNETKELYDPPQLRKWAKFEGFRQRFVGGVIGFLRRAATALETRLGRAN